MLSCDSGSGKNSIENLKEFVGILHVFKPCCRKYNERKRNLELIYYDKIHNGCKVTIDLKSSMITIKVFIHSDTLKVAEHTFNPTDFRKYVTPFFTPAEVEKQKRFDDQVEEQRLMAEQREFEKQEKKSRMEALEKAHRTEPKTCGGDDICEFCKSKKAQRSVCMWKRSSPPITGT